MSWDDEDADWEALANDTWDTEESDDGGGAAAAWDAEEDEAVLTEHVVVGTKAKNEVKYAANKNKPKKLTKAARKKKDAEFAARETERMKAAMRKGPISVAAAAAEKVKLQKLVEESDNDLTNELFGDHTIRSKAQDAVSVAVIFGKLMLEDMDACSQAGEQLSKRLLLEKSSGKTIRFCKDLIRGVAPELTGDQILDLIKLLNVLKNTMTKQELGKKKKNKKKSKLKMGGKGSSVGGDMFHGMDAGGNYAAEDFDDGDFM